MRTSRKQIETLETVIRYLIPEFRMCAANVAGGINKPWMRHNGEKVYFKTNTELFAAAAEIASELAKMH